MKGAKYLAFCCWIAYMLALTVFLPIVCPYKSFSLWFGWIPTFLAWSWLWVVIIFIGFAIYVYNVEKQTTKGQEG